MTIILHVVFVVSPGSFDLFSSIDINDFVLVDVFKYVWGVHEDPDGSHCGHDEEDVQLKTVNNHGNEFPVLANLEITKRKPLVFCSLCKN